MSGRCVSLLTRRSLKLGARLNTSLGLSVNTFLSLGSESRICQCLCNVFLNSDTSGEYFTQHNGLTLWSFFMLFRSKTFLLCYLIKAFFGRVNPYVFVTSIEISSRHVCGLCLVGSIIATNSTHSVELTDRKTFDQRLGRKNIPM